MTRNVIPRSRNSQHDCIEEIELDITGRLAASGTQLRLQRLPKKICPRISTRTGCEAEQRKIHLRELHRRSQGRYREKQRLTLHNLEDSVNRLHEEVKVLKYRHFCASRGICDVRNIWTIAVEYFRIFGRGYTKDLNGLALRFLQESITSDVIDGYLRGSSALFHSWVFWSVDLQSMEQRTKNFLLATTCTSFMISTNRLGLVFPRMRWIVVRNRPLCQVDNILTRDMFRLKPTTSKVLKAKTVLGQSKLET
ncbi:hypothetical protein PHMEG_0008643 [Phytophthora megakarya]|uniref:Bzip transcription factor n=1 Tax=Phytophthora megakarya TaxID=4795 RepID=A0A225WJW7_9STRA|nr:hypothetical protein PHMEG_0008643 [Phytophthora megakarya]